MTRRRTLAVAGLCVALGACHPTRTERDTVRRWLLCEECNRGELDAVAALKDRVTGMLADALKGPPASGREHVRRQAEERFKRLVSPAFTLSAYVAHYDSNYVATYQAHAAVALGRIGTPAARAALFTAMQNDSVYRSDVLRAFAVAAPVVLDTAAGASQAAPRDSAVRVDPSASLFDTIANRAVPNIRVAFTVDSGGGKVTDSIRRTDGTGVASTHWTLGTGPDSVNVLRATTFRRSVTFRATGHGLTPRLAFAARPANGTEGQPLPAIKVFVLDAWDQKDTTVSGTAQAVIIGTGASATGPVVKGIVDFPNLVPNTSGAAFQIRVKAVGATPAVSEPFDVAP